jgi:arylsulfatase A-like enzyme
VLLVLLGAVAGLVLGIVEVAYLCATALGYFDGPLELGAFALATMLPLAAAGALVGAAEAGVAAIARSRNGRALAAAIASAPAIGWLATQLFAGPRAQQIPGHAAIAWILAVCGIAAVYAIGRFWRATAISCAAAAAIAIGAYLCDQRVLVRLYPWFHAALAGIAFVAVELALGTLARLRGWRPSLRTAAIASLAVVAGGAAALGLLERSRGLRTFALERTATLAPLVRLAHRNAPTAPPRAPAVADGSKLPDGPHLGASDVFLVTVDALRADCLTPEIAPNLSALAARGVRFDRAYTQVPHTSFSVATLLTGKPMFALSTLGIDAGETLAKILRRERYKTAAFYPPSVFTIDRERLRALEASNYDFEYVKYEYLPAPARTEQLFAFLDEEKPARTFVWVHYLEPHEPYDVHPGATRGDSARARYEGEIRFVDAEVGRLIARLEKERPHALIVVAADHGEEFGEHGGHYHGTTLFEEQVHVPLFFTALDGALAPRRVAQPAGLVDVAPTILSLIGIPRSLKMRGRDLGPWLSGAETRRPEFAEIGRKKMVVDGDDKLICDLESDSCQLFDLARDPAEQRDSTDETRRAQLKGELDGWLADGARFERGRAVGANRVLERGRQGEAAAARDLAGLLTGDEEVAREAAELIASLPPDPATAVALAKAAQASDETLRRWAAIARARLGVAEARHEVAGFVGEACEAEGPMCARAALALGETRWLAIALDRLNPDGEEALEAQVAHALARSRSPEALDPLLEHLADVRPRLEVLKAIGELGDVRALPTLERWLPAEPYTGVRAEMVRVVAQLGGAGARPTLEALQKSEREPAVIRALNEALATATAGTPRSRQ